MHTTDLHYTSTHFSVHNARTSAGQLHLVMQVAGTAVNTREFPRTLGLLRAYCPLVLATECFNDDNLPFREEVKRTEIGHLFEHLLLTYLCHSKANTAGSRRSYEGKTSWNWKREPWGRFHIYLPDTNARSLEFTTAYRQALRLTDRVMSN